MNLVIKWHVCKVFVFVSGFPLDFYQQPLTLEFRSFPDVQKRSPCVCANVAQKFIQINKTFGQYWARRLLCFFFVYKTKPRLASWLNLNSDTERPPMSFGVTGFNHLRPLVPSWGRDLMGCQTPRGVGVANFWGMSRKRMLATTVTKDKMA